MDSIRIDTGLKRIAINDDETRVIQFNPTDILFAEKFYALMQDFEARQAEYMQRAEALDDDTAVDDNGLPANLKDRIAFMREFCKYWHAQIDVLFGDGTAQAAFHGALGIEMIQQFFEGVTPFVRQAREQKIGPYRPHKSRSKKAMK